MEEEEALENRLERAAAAADQQEAALLRDAADRLADQRQRIDSLQDELEETNEGMVALTLELQEAERRYRSLFEDAVEGIYKTTPDARRFRMVNDSLADILGYGSPDELCETVTIRDVFVDDERYEAYRSALERGEQLDNFEYRVHRADGTVRWVSDNVRMISEGSDERGYRGGIVDITERKKYEQRLESRNEALEALNRVVRHDIGNDVQVISTWAERLQDNVDPQGRDALARIRQKAESITDITREVGTVVETLAADEETNLEPVSLEPTLLQEVERLRDAHPEAEVTIRTSIPFVQVVGNNMLGTVFRNVLRNAIEHNDSDAPVVEVGCERTSDSVVVRIADDGPGVPDDRKGDIFGKGTQSLDSAGSGIGLYLVHYLLTEYGGSVAVEDATTTADSSTDGAVFVLELPVAAGEQMNDRQREEFSDLTGT